MADSLIGQFLVDKEQQAEIEKLEQLKRIGRNFIRVVYTGRNVFPRYHGFNNVGIVTEYDPESGRDVPRAEDQARVVEFRKGPDGRMIADILDDEQNRYTISRHLGMDLEVEDPRLAKEIAALVGKSYEPEPDRKTQLLREKRRIDEELAALSHTGKGRRGGRRRTVGGLVPTEEPAEAVVTEGDASG